jgi:hypothetical protein
MVEQAQTPQHPGKLTLFEKVVLPLTILATALSIFSILQAHIDAEKLVEKLVGTFELQGNNTVKFENGSFKVPKGPIQISFWTPSARTKNTAGVKDWEKVESDARLDEFGDRLKKKGLVTGYRRVEVIGDGRGGRMAGAWWISSNDRDFHFADFLREYLDFWKPPGEDQVYMEVQPIAEGYQKPGASEPRQ